MEDSESKANERSLDGSTVTVHDPDALLVEMQNATRQRHQKKMEIKEEWLSKVALNKVG